MEGLPEQRPTLRKGHDEKAAYYKRELNCISVGKGKKMSKKIAVIVGSLRKDSYSRKTAKALISVAPKDLEFNFVEIADLPIYNEDLETDTPPAAWTKFRNEIMPADGILFVTPEYNRGIPGGLKNAIDVGSRPYGKSVWNKKSGAVVSISQGGIGGFGANHILRQSLVFCDILVLQQPEAYIGMIQNFVTDDGKPADEKTAAYFATIMNAFADLTHKIRP